MEDEKIDRAQHRDDTAEDRRKVNRHTGELHRQNRRLEALLHISRTVQKMTHPVDVAEVLRVCLDELKTLGLDIQTVAFHRMVDPAQRTVRTFRIGFTGPLSVSETRKSTALTRCWQNSETVYKKDLPKDEPESVDAFHHKFGSLFPRSLLDVPISRGVISAHSIHPDAFSEADVALLKQVAEILSVGISRVEDLERAEASRQAFEQSETRFRNLVEQIHDIIWEVDENGAYTYCSPAVHRILGYEPEEMLGKTPFDFMPSAEAQRVGEIFSRIAAAGQPFAFLEHRCICKDGREVFIECSGAPTFDERGRFQGYRGIDRDITGRVKAAETHARLVEILEATPDFVGIAGPDGTLVYLNSGGRTMMGIGKDEDISTTRISDYHPDRINEYLRKEALPTAMREGTWKGEGAFLARDGREIPASMVVVAHKNADGGVACFSTISRDITERKRAEQLLCQTAERLQLTLDNLPLIAYEIDTEGRWVLSRGKGLEALGRRPDEVVGESLFTFYQGKPAITGYIPTKVRKLS